MASRRGLTVYLMTALTVATGMIFSAAVTGEAATVTVCASGCDYQTITAAVLGVPSGSTIKVKSGYDPAGETFPIVIDKKEVTISCESGAVIEVPASRAGITIVPNGDGSTVENCEIRSAGVDLGDVGIVVLVADPVTIAGNKIHDLLEGIRLIKTNGNTIKKNEVYYIGREVAGPIDPHTGICIHLEDSKGNKLWRNECRNSGVGLFLNKSDENSVERDSYRENAFVGVHLEESNDNKLGVEDLDGNETVEGVSITANGGWGFYLIGSDRNTIARSEISGNKGGGIKLEGSNENTIGCVSANHCGNYIHDNGDGLDEDINILLTKGTLVAFSAPIIEDQLSQSPSAKLKGENLVGKADGFEITKQQIDQLKKTLATRLNGDPELKDITAKDIKAQVTKLTGSQHNIIASNVITSKIDNDEGRNIGIKLEPGAFENILVNNLITNEKVQEPAQRGRFGKLDRGIVLLSSSNKILFNAIEFLDVGIVRGGANARRDVKHLHLFTKLALVCDQSVTGCPSGKDEKVIISEIEEETIEISTAASVKFNRLALNFIENNGIGIDVVDAESNLIDENLFLDNLNGGIVLSRLESQGFWGVIDVRIEENDFVGGYSIVNLSILPLDVRNNYQTASQTVGELKLPAAPDRFCEANFEKKAKFQALGDELGLPFALGDFFIEPPGGLPPNTEFLPSDVVLPDGKPRDCNPDVFPPGGGGKPGSRIPQLAGTQGPPHDLDKDGLYEDVNGNGRPDFDDAVALARNLESQAVRDNKRAFDFNGNGRVDFDDAVKLAYAVGGRAAAQALREMFGPAELRVTAVSARPDRTSHTTDFTVQGRGIAEIKVEIFDLAGKRIYDSGFVSGNRLTWCWLSGPGRAFPANGVYLYIATVKGHTGELLRTEVRRLVVLK